MGLHLGLAFLDLNFDVICEVGKRNRNYNANLSSRRGCSAMTYTPQNLFGFS